MDYKKLTIENFVKTEWFNQFDKKQKTEIVKGFVLNVDISIYAKKEFHWTQMEQIRLGLEKNLDVSIYATEDFFGCEMEEIRLDLKSRSGIFK